MDLFLQVLDIICGVLGINGDASPGKLQVDDDLFLQCLGTISILASHSIIQSTIHEPSAENLEMANRCKARLNSLRDISPSKADQGMLSLIGSLLQLPVPDFGVDAEDKQVNTDKINASSNQDDSQMTTESTIGVVPTVVTLFLTYDIVTSPCYMPESEIIERWKRAYSLLGHTNHQTMVSEMIMAAMIGLVEDRTRTALDKNHLERAVLWESYMAGCLARFIAGLLEDEAVPPIHIVEPAITTVLRYKSLIKAVTKTFEQSEVGGQKCITLFLRGCEKLSLISSDFATENVSNLLGDSADVQMQESAILEGEVALEDIVASLREDSSERNIKIILQLLRPEVDQPRHVQTIVKLLNALSKEFDLQLLAGILKVLMVQPRILKVLFHHSQYRDTLSILRQLVDTWTIDDDISGDSQSSYESYGIIYTFVFHCTIMFRLNDSKVDALGDESGFFALWLNSPGHVFDLKEMDEAKTSKVNRWITALFDSDGISDDLIKSSRPQDMLTLTPTIFRQCITACQAGVIDFDALKGALEYFLQPFLSYTLLSAVQYLIWEIASGNALQKVAFDVLDTLVSSESFPTSILRPLATQIIDCVFSMKNPKQSVAETSASSRLRKKAEEALDGYPDLQPWTALSSPPTLLARFKTMIASVAAGVPQFVTDDDDVAPWDPAQTAFQGLPDLVLAGDMLKVFGPRPYVETLIRETFASPLSMAMVQGQNNGTETMNLSYTPPLIVLASKLLTVPMVYSWNYHLQPINLLRILFTQTLPSLSVPTPDPLDVTSALRTSSASFIQGRLVGLLLIHIVVATLDPSMRVDDLTLIDHVQREGERRRNAAQNMADVQDNGLGYSDDDFRGFIHAMQLNNNRLAWDRAIPIELRNYVVSSLASVPNV